MLQSSPRDLDPPAAATAIHDYAGHLRLSPPLSRQLASAGHDVTPMPLSRATPAQRRGCTPPTDPKGLRFERWAKGIALLEIQLLQAQGAAMSAYGRGAEGLRQAHERM